MVLIFRLLQVFKYNIFFIRNWICFTFFRLFISGLHCLSKRLLLIDKINNLYFIFANSENLFNLFIVKHIIFYNIVFNFCFGRKETIFIFAYNWLIINLILVWRISIMVSLVLKIWIMGFWFFIHFVELHWGSHNVFYIFIIFFIDLRLHIVPLNL